MNHTESKSPAEIDDCDLEAVLLELAFEFVDFTASGFDMAVYVAAEKVNASVLFNVRFDQPRYQRAAGVQMNPLGRIYLLLLDRPGRKVSVLPVDAEHRRIIDEVTAWAAQPLPLQADANSQTQLKLLLYAACSPLRSAS